MDTSITAETVYRDCYWTDDSRNAFREAVKAEGLPACQRAFLCAWRTRGC